MKSKLILYFSICMIMHINSIAQSNGGKIITLYEIAPDKKSAIKVSDLRIVDINSSINISLNKDTLIRSASKYLNIDTGSKLEELDKYNRLLHNVDTLLSLTNKALRASETNEEELNKLLDALEIFYEELMKESELRKEIEIRWNDYVNANGKDGYDIFVMNYLVGQRNTLASSIDSTFQKNRIRFSVVANRVDAGNTRIHVENYDDMSTGEFYEVPRWITTLSEEDQQKLKEYEKISEELNKNHKEFIELVAKKLQGELASAQNIVSIKNKIIALEKYINQLDQQTKDLLNKFILETRTDLMNMASITDRFKNVTILTPFEILNTDIHLLDSILNDFTVTFTKRYDVFKNKLTGPLRDSINNINSEVNLLNKNLSADIKNIKDLLETIKIHYNISKKVYTDNQEISEEVRKFSASNIPEKGFIDLRYTGKRIAGDEIMIRVIARKEEDRSGRTENTTLERHILKMNKVALYNETCVSLIMTSPFDKDKTELINDFQFSPSTSFVFKAGARNNRFWNFLDLGAGFNFATTDYDLNGTPEFGAGISLTLIKNTVATGVNYNFAMDVPYWFIGLNLPIRTNLFGQGVDTKN